MTPRNTSWVGVALRVGPTVEGSRFFFPVVQRTESDDVSRFIYPSFLLLCCCPLFIYLFDATQQHHLSNGGETDSFLPPSPLVFSTPKILMINIRFTVP